MPLALMMARKAHANVRLSFCLIFWNTKYQPAAFQAASAG